MELNQNRVFSLSFVPAERDKGNRYPQIVFKTTSEHAANIDKLLQDLKLKQQTSKDDEYLGKHMPFSCEKNGHFGFGRCGLRFEDDGEISYGVQLCGYSRTPQVALTVAYLLDAFQLVHGDASCKKDEVKANRQQLLYIFGRCRNDLHGHSLGGWVFPAFGSWLASIGKKASEKVSSFDIEAYQGTRLLPEVEKAMKEAWRAVAPQNLKRYADECRAGVHASGRFSLSCFGDACDLSIYPDLAERIDVGHMVQFACHNLDTAPQQLTLLAGLAAMHDLASKELG